MRERKIAAAGMLGVSLILSSCISQDLDTQRTQSINTIEVVRPENPAHVGLAIGSAGAAIGLGLAMGPGATSGALVESAGEAAADTKLTDALASQNLRLGDELGKAVEEALSREGYNTQSTPTLAADATLKLKIDDVTYERRVWGKIAPHLIVTARLSDASGKQIFARTYSYDRYAQIIGYKMLRPPKEFCFDDSSEVLAHPDLVAAGLKAGITMIAADLSATLRK